jgi:hypothetical protein
VTLLCSAFQKEALVVGVYDLQMREEYAYILKTKEFARTLTNCDTTAQTKVFQEGLQTLL